MKTVLIIVRMMSTTRAMRMADQDLLRISIGKRVDDAGDYSIQRSSRLIVVEIVMVGSSFLMMVRLFHQKPRVIWSFTYG